MLYFIVKGVMFSIFLYCTLVIKCYIKFDLSYKNYTSIISSIKKN